MLSMGGKEVLIEAIAQDRLVFAMIVFNISKKICKGVIGGTLQFWWGDDDDHKKKCIV
jgi:hypothetical protein